MDKNKLLYSNTKRKKRIGFLSFIAIVLEKEKVIVTANWMKIETYCEVFARG